MKKYTLIMDGKLQNGKSIYDELNIENQMKDVHIVYIESTFPKTMLERLIYYSNFLKLVGFCNFISLLFSKKSIIITEGCSRFYKLISRNVIFINHGWGTKATPGNDEINNAEAMKDYQLLIDTADYIICNSKFDETYFLKNDKLKNREKLKFLYYGMPRNDKLIQYKNNEEYKKEILEALSINKEKYRKILLYAPTHRDNDKMNERVMKQLAKEINHTIERFAEEKILLLFRPHYYCTDIDHLINKSEYIKLVDSETYPDVRDLMLISDCLMTDYSSIFVDYLLLDKQIIFYCFDLDSYSLHRGLVINYSDDIQTPGDKIGCFGDLFEIINSKKKTTYMDSKQFFYGSSVIEPVSTKKLKELIITIKESKCIANI